MNPFSCNNGSTPSFQPGMRPQANQCLRDVAVGGVGGVFAGTGTGLTGCTMFGQGANPYCVGGSVLFGGSIGGAYGAKGAWSSSDSCQKAFCPQK
ncbi:hypothetical protein JCM24511_09029 [Saitozyma sp. JCM 24511]|nr:hypothetical protein JCM24511_09029 [Saitozyma sp. JCM 24511]